MARLPKLVTQKAYAELRGVSPQYVNKLLREGKVAKHGKLIDPREVDAARKAYHQVGRLAVAPKHRSKKPQTSAPGGVRSIEKKPRKAPEETAAYWKTEGEKYKALNAKLEHEKTIGNLLDREQVKRALQKQYEHFRTAHRGLPRSLAPHIARCTSAAEVEDLLRKELDRVLETLARDPLDLHETPETETEPEAAAVQTPAIEAPPVVAEPAIAEEVCL